MCASVCMCVSVPVSVSMSVFESLCVCVRAWVRGWGAGGGAGRGGAAEYVVFPISRVHSRFAVPILHSEQVAHHGPRGAIFHR